jgi:quercetin dioxygenase-like cupin family protein
MLAAELALGALAPEAHMAATARLHADGRFAAEVADWEIALAPLALEMAPVEPTAGLIERIEVAIDRRAAPMPSGRTLRAHEGEWIDYAPGVRAKVLWRNETTRREGVLLEVDPGATYPEHDHDDDEEFYMLSGDIAFGDVVLYAGDYHVAYKGSHHGGGVSRNGCRCIMVQGMA